MIVTREKFEKSTNEIIIEYKEFLEGIGDL